MRKFVRKDLIPQIDIIFESFRPGVMESVELGPEDIHAINPKVIYVRISGFGRDPQNQNISNKAGRDLTYLASSGGLSKIRRNNKVGVPAVPANVLSYYASGTMYTLARILSAIYANKPYTVIDANLTMQLAYTAQPMLLDAHLNHR